MLDDHTLLVTDHQAGQNVMDEIKAFTNDHYEFIKVPEQVPSNILSLDNGKFIIYQKDFPKSEMVIIKEIQEKRGVATKALCMSELIKADGALTCCSILVQ
jgi:dimethylargininase